MEKQEQPPIRLLGAVLVSIEGGKRNYFGQKNKQ